ncbi:thiamine biosynthesis lipoprotein [Franzmannia pantelleriensis]|uniref:FAD:protein FMN transferase n=1 Tax=Franzmannia pantelleriensis TaxID=48727 RepID=A0A1G9L447_9GAMM|nr:FAD:protein FMN transferase [Halomonas pantelleriensis]SDL56778.1 thiamine biosynthesis lipoprotein [Halomonas pantelleriensis]
MNVIRLLLLSLLPAALLAGCGEQDPELDSPVRLEGNIFGSFYQVTIADPLTRSQAEDLEEGFVAELDDVDAAMSIYRDDSELMDLNNTPVGEWLTLSDALFEVLAVSQSVAAESDGSFDVTIGGLVNLWSFGSESRPQEVPSPEDLAERLAEVGYDKLELDASETRARRTGDVFIDLGGVAKGHGTDRVAAYLDAQGIEHYLVNLGGDLIVKGYRDEQQNPWRIGVEVPDGSRQVAHHTLPLHDISVATSGDYRNYFEADGRRYSHTIDPRSGTPIEHSLASVTVLHPSNAWADAWATALMVLGPEQGLQLAEQHSLMVMLLVRDGDGWATRTSSAFIDYFGAETLADIGIDVDD